MDSKMNLDKYQKYVQASEKQTNRIINNINNMSFEETKRKLELFAGELWIDGIAHPDPEAIEFFEAIQSLLQQHENLQRHVDYMKEEDGGIWT